MKMDERQASLNKIKTSKTVRVILISFKAGSTGLNLTCCSRVILVDLWWNPALEVRSPLPLHLRVCRLTPCTGASVRPCTSPRADA
jgi:hypothetical protein